MVGTSSAEYTGSPALDANDPPTGNTPDAPEPMVQFPRLDLKKFISLTALIALVILTGTIANLRKP